MSRYRDALRQIAEHGPADDRDDPCWGVAQTARDALRADDHAPQNADPVAWLVEGDDGEVVLRSGPAAYAHADATNGTVTPLYACPALWAQDAYSQRVVASSDKPSTGQERKP